MTPNILSNMLHFIEKGGSMTNIFVLFAMKTIQNKCVLQNHANTSFAVYIERMHTRGGMIQNVAPNIIPQDNIIAFLQA
eukprot:6477676-Ditylum_brightwellii.AAC.1